MRPQDITPPQPGDGFCYLNNIAIATLEALATGARRVAVYDFDVHHGNGTEDILLDRPGAAFFSIHQHPCYPGTGTRHRGSNCFNYCVAPHTPRAEYRRVLQTALEALQKFNPDVVLVSAGFDAYAHDPIAQETLRSKIFIGWERLCQLEYTHRPSAGRRCSDDLPELIFAYLKAWLANNPGHSLTRPGNPAIVGCWISFENSRASPESAGKCQNPCITRKRPRVWS